MGIVTEFKPVQLEKHDSAIVVTDVGKVTELILVQSEKALFPIKVTEVGIVIEVKPEQLEKADSAIEVTEVGKATELKLVQPEKALPPI